MVTALLPHGGRCRCRCRCRCRWCGGVGADFANALDEAEPEAREALIRGVLVRTIDATGYLREAEEGVAAALIAAQCPEGDPVDSTYGPESPMPLFLSDLRALADEALARIVSDEDGPASNWVGPEAGRGGEPYARASARCLPRHPLPTLSSIFSRNRALLGMELEPESELANITTPRSVRVSQAT
ncbi:DUF4259 domain-containing protein [Streptomyces sp. NPDC046821]|uniref:DUF4259 domain-containing protein n=1 Tax=Streptomyces sp. NPDC046821 TaxID=3154702 RepID=UPI0033BFF9FB